MAERKITVVADFKDNVSGKVQTMAGNVQKSSKKATQESNKLAQAIITKYLGAEAAIRIFELSIRGVVDSLKEFAKESGSKTLDSLARGFRQIQVEVGYVLMPTLERFNKWFIDNEATIMSWVRGGYQRVHRYHTHCRRHL